LISSARRGRWASMRLLLPWHTPSMAMSGFHPLQTLARSATVRPMRCYYVLVHGTLDWVPGAPAGDEFGAKKPAAFSPSPCPCLQRAAAIDTAFSRVRANLDRELVASGGQPPSHSTPRKSPQLLVQACLRRTTEVTPLHRELMSSFHPS
jgi:hypothetical protein